MANGGTGAPAPALTTVRLPAEWEPHASTWLQWPRRSERRFVTTFCEITRTVQTGELVHIMVSNSPAEQSALETLDRAGVRLAGVQFHRVPTDSCWCRDNGPMFAIDEQGPFIVDWGFNAWGHPEWPHARDDAVPSRVAGRLGLRVVCPDLVVEGGALEWNGDGVLLASEPCLTSRNPHSSRARIEATLSTALGARQIVWLSRYPSEDEITFGHPDGIARFISHDTVVVGETTRADADWEVFEHATARIRDAGLKVRRMAIPGRLDGASANYLNWYVCNCGVVVAVFGRERWDCEAIATVRSYFPGRPVVGVRVNDLWRSGGGVHCVTQQEPSCGPQRSSGTSVAADRGTYMTSGSPVCHRGAARQGNGSMAGFRRKK